MEFDDGVLNIDKELSKLDEFVVDVAGILDDLHDMLSDGLLVRIAEQGRMTPNFELWFPKNEYDRRGLDEPLVANVAGHDLNISPLEHGLPGTTCYGRARNVRRRTGGPGTICRT